MAALPTSFLSSLLDNGQPLISCSALPVAELHRRADLAEGREEQLQLTHNQPTGRYGREIMWHPSFPPEFVSLISHTPLPEIGAWLLDCHAEAMNQGHALDLLDFCYLADCLREGLVDNPTPLAALRLARALACVEQAGRALLPAPVHEPATAPLALAA